MNNRGILILIVIVLLAGAGIGWFVLTDRGPRSSDVPASGQSGSETNTKENGDRSLANANTNSNTNSKGDSRTTADSTLPSARSEAGRVSIRLRVLDARGELIRDAFVSSSSNPAPSIERHEVEILIEGAAPLNISIFADGYFGTRHLEYKEQPAAPDVRVTLARKVSVRLNVKLEGGAKTDGVSGLFVASSGDSSNYQFIGIDGVMADAPEGEGEAGWSNGYYQSDFKKVKFTDGMNLDLSAAARAVGTVKIQCKEKPSLQFWIDPSG
ncbi:MAG: hypothetical protein ACKVS6_01615 [Planctomycetota bacterium]